MLSPALWSPRHARGTLYGQAEPSRTLGRLAALSARPRYRQGPLLPARALPGIPRESAEIRAITSHSSARCLAFLPNRHARGAAIWRAQALREPRLTSWVPKPLLLDVADHLGTAELR